MPRRRKPNHLHQIAGTYRPVRHGPREAPQGDLLPDAPPADFPADVRQAWLDVTAAGAGHLRAHDAPLVEVAARALARVRSPAARSADSANFLRAALALQLDPAHRPAFRVPAEDNEFNEF